MWAKLAIQSGLFNCDCTALQANGRKQGCGVLWCGHAGSVKTGCLMVESSTVEFYGVG